MCFLYRSKLLHMPYPVLKYYHAPWRYCIARLRSQTTKDFKRAEKYGL